MFTSGYSFGEGDIVLPDDLKAELVKRGKLRIWLKIIEHSIRRRVAEAVLSAHIDKYGIKRKTLDTLKADYPTAAALILFLREILQDPEGVDELYDRFDLFNEIEHSME